MGFRGIGRGSKANLFLGLTIYLVFEKKSGRLVTTNYMATNRVKGRWAHGYLATVALRIQMAVRV